MTARFRCALYTRKSSEEGLEQGFNSLHAQREACEAYVLSQAGEGWQALAAIYDDGGYSGGTMERPGLQRLLADIERGLIDIVVVYKVDRLTRSLADFAKIVERFDAQGVSFVSVTQAFNTTNSMGRLTLNVLLSFAQFEREVTGERIRDKIAASKAKGLRMGGRPPLGYDVVDLRLVINQGEAETVRHIFQRYLELGSCAALAADLRMAGLTSKRWINRRGLPVGGATLSRGALYHLLSNPVYRGVNRHKDRHHQGAHPPIIDEAVWEAAQTQLAAANGASPQGARTTDGALLGGLIFDDRGHPMSHVHTKRGAMRYRYYLSRPIRSREGEPLGSLPRLSAGVLEAFLIPAIEARLAPAWRPQEDASERARSGITRLVVSADEIRLHLRADAARADLLDGWNSDDDGVVEVRLPIVLKRREGAVLIASEDGAASVEGKVDRTLVRAVVLARAWAQELAAGRFASIRELAHGQGLCPSHTMRLAPLAYLAPDLVTMILEGRQPAWVSLKVLTAKPLPLDWRDQRDLFRVQQLARVSSLAAAA